MYFFMVKKHPHHMNPFFLTIIIVVVLAILWTVGSWLAVRTIEEPAYTVVEQTSDYEIREYAPYIVAEVETTGVHSNSLNQGFRLLADYIFGNNTKDASIAMTAPVTESFSESIAMTAPVVEQGRGEKRRVTFSMPSKYTMETLPRPNNSAVNIRQIPAQKIAVRRFSWWASDARIDRMQSVLLNALYRDKREVIGDIGYAGYNPPLSAPWIRRNEVMVEIR